MGSAVPPPHVAAGRWPASVPAARDASGRRVEVRRRTRLTGLRATGRADTGVPTVNTGAVFGRKSKFTSWDDVVAAVDGWLELIRDGEFVVYDEPSGGFVQYARIGDQLHRRRP